MIALWMAYGMAAGVGLLLAATLLESGLRAIGRPSRFVWLSAMAATLVVSAAALLPRSAPASVDETASSESAVAGAGSGGGAFVAADGWIDRWSGARPPVLDRVGGVLLAAWLGASAVVLLLYAGSALRLRYRRARWGRAVVRGVPVLVSDGAGPAVIGFVSPTIVVPSWVLWLDASTQDLVLAHERQHVAARDPLLVVAAFVGVVAAPWNVAVWAMRSRLRRAVEMDCDQRVLAATPARAAYASLLIELGARMSDAPALAPALVGWTTDLERRVVTILEPAPRQPGRLAVRVAAAAALALAVVAAPRPAVSLQSGTIAGSANPAAPEAGSSARAIGAVPHDGGASNRSVRATQIDSVRRRAASAIFRSRGGGARVGAGAGPASAGGRSFAISVDTVAAIIERRHPRLLASGGADPIVIAIAFDVDGRLLDTRVLDDRQAGELGVEEPRSAAPGGRRGETSTARWSASSTSSVAPALARLFPGLTAGRLRSSGRVIGDVKGEDRAPRRAVAIFGVYDPD